MGQQGQPTSNKGQVGIPSIRIGGMQVADLPLVAGAHAKMGLPLAIDNERKQNVKKVLKMYPTQKVSYLRGAMRESQANINTQTNFKAETAAKIANYEGQRGGVEYGRQQLEKLDPGGEIASFFGQIGAEQIRAKAEGREPDVPEVDEAMYAKYEQIKSIRVNFPPYNEKAMDAQIELFRAGILAADKVIGTEYNSIAEFTGVLVLCERRDAELTALGVGIVKAVE